MAKQTWQVTETEAGQRLDKWLAAPARLGSRAKAFDAIARGKVYITEREQTALDAGRKLLSGETVMVWTDKPGSAKQRIFTDRKVSALHLLYEDEALLVLNKPAGMLCVPLATQPEEMSLFDEVSDYLRKHTKNKPQIVHRIDRDTSGVVLFAKTGAARENLKQQFIAHKPERIYHALVYGIPQPETGSWRDWLIWDEKDFVQREGDPRDQRTVEAKCLYRVLKKFTTAALLEIKLITGKQNQIRVQAAIHQHQLVGERQYLMHNPPLKKIEFARQALHAYQLSITHPLSNRKLEFIAPLPPDLQQLLNNLP